MMGENPLLAFISKAERLKFKVSRPFFSKFQKYGETSEEERRPRDSNT